MNVVKLNISRRVGLIDKFKELKYKAGVEVGTDHGGYAKNICERYPELTLFTIDPWLAYTEGDEVKSQEEVDKIFEYARQTLEPYDNCLVIRKTSMDAVQDFKLGSIDFVFIDGNHEYEYVKEDIEEWSKIVKPGGIICGHDYKKDDGRKYGVIEAVNEYVEKNNIETLYILEKGSFVPCWMFYKP